MMFADRPRLARLISQYGLEDDLRLHDNLKLALAQLSDDEAAQLFDRMPEGFSLLDDPDKMIFLGRLTGASAIPVRQVSRSDFTLNRSARAGVSNPQRHLPDFWSEQIRTGKCGFQAARDWAGETGGSGSPVWSFQRFGASYTRLPDGRWVVIAGEHEDHYDDDFCIYGDVTVFGGEDGVAHYIYPQDVFPPTDFHTATLLEDHILLIGSLGYLGQRPGGRTQVLRLNLNDFSIETVDTDGENPGWIHRHEAVRVGDDILVTGGIIEPGYRENTDTFALHLPTMAWRRID